MSDDLDGAVREYLREVIDIARNGADADVLLLVRSEVPRLVASWWQLVESHRPDGRGRCCGCAPRRRRRRRGPSWPCEIHQTARLHLIAQHEYYEVALRAVSS